MNILHVDVDDALRPLLAIGVCIDSALTPETVGTIPKKQTVECITCKSQSRLTKDVLSGFPLLRLVVARMVGTDTIDLSYCKDHGIAVYHIPDYGAQVVVEHALALILAGSRHIVQADTAVRKGKFSYKPFLGYAIGGKTVGVVGTGKIGIALVKLLSGFGVTILAYDVMKNVGAAKQYGFTYVPLRTLLKRSDVVSLHVPLLPQTKHLISDTEFRLMKPGSILVNTSRGAILDTKALVKYIGKFFAVCLDVLENEESFTMKHALLRFNNVIITPHIAFYTDVSLRNIANSTMAIIERYLDRDTDGRVI